MYELTIKSTFSSAHNLRGYEGACENLHGHNWKVEVSVRAEALDPIGMVMDFKKLKAEARKTLSKLDHRYLNEVPPFDSENATAENLARFIFTEISGALNSGAVRVSKVVVWESDDASAAYYG
ncbi:MAG: 6-carboxytetrahydropterin synthase QueD [Deltaproteobacteria bacterium]|nr:6-carboxytetrahydropterin synthase QueD [Deltaproteobacteria bacterium]